MKIVREGEGGGGGVEFLHDGNYFVRTVENYLTQSSGRVLRGTFGRFKLDLDYI